ncbi:hypothetical protein QE357_002717 [Siphonobacter sp. BAB-5404]|nr:hypothetical protein [Siphonobacter sp. SORGH_AS_0500]
MTPGLQIFVNAILPMILTLCEKYVQNHNDPTSDEFSKHEIIAMAMKVYIAIIHQTNHLQ